jgi:hypothetical protein
VLFNDNSGLIDLNSFIDLLFVLFLFFWEDGGERDFAFRDFDFDL